MYRVNNVISDQHEESLLLGAHSKFPQHPSLMLLDAHVIFQPLLTSMGLMPHQIIGYNFDNWGSHMSIRVSIEALKIDIVESEGKGSGQGSMKGKKMGVLNLSHESPAFLCEKVSLDGDFQKSTDMSKDTLNKRSMLYFSRNYWKKQVKSSLVFCLNIDYISQQVNMPLLRLLHQITTMFQNVRETQLELRERRPSQTAKSLLDHKNSSTSGSDIHEALQVPFEKETNKTTPVDSISAPALVDANMRNTLSTTKGSTASRSQSFAQRFKTSGKGRGNFFHCCLLLSVYLASFLAVRLGTNSFDVPEINLVCYITGPKIVVDGAVRNSSASQTPTSTRATDFLDTEPNIAMANTPETTAANISNVSHQSCWKTIYFLLDLYATRPETKTVFNTR